MHHGWREERTARALGIVTTFLDSGFRQGGILELYRASRFNLNLAVMGGALTSLNWKLEVEVPAKEGLAEPHF